MIDHERSLAPYCATQVITTDETEFANTFYEVAEEAGLEVEIEVLANAPRFIHRLTFLCADDDLICSLYQTAHNRRQMLFWREMVGVKEAIENKI